ncbi:MAG: UDP-3-O-(3-hydroxymyristoyl)glucosamine N-acyltransferase [Flavobacteriaceae bacterium]|nr:UDP-3-O-(3-hydroxymyristoyl)glucosamine N-acyltransferase [Flavobacteriaceae bacterium]|tara:strand:- start:2281 stop:3273 length:993 start_codon:yes stop_codon:yes gene_type:complete
MKAYNLEQIANLISGEIHFKKDIKISGLNDLKNATKEEITFIGSNKFKKYWADSKAGAAIVNESIKIDSKDRPIIFVKDADISMATLLETFSPDQGPVFEKDIDPSASIHPSATIGKDVKIGASCYIGKDVVIGSGSLIYANVSIFDNTAIGKNCIFWSGTVIRENSIIGNDCIFHSNVSIGADGFGYRPSPDGNGLLKIPHIGNVVIGNNVEIGANTCVDRAKFNSTIVGDGCKIDNLVQIAHNCIMGKSCIMSGNSGLAGTVTLGDGVTIGGSASIRDHTTIGSGASVGAGSGVISDVAAGETVLGYPATESKEMLRQWVALKRLAKN